MSICVPLHLIKSEPKSHHLTDHHLRKQHKMSHFQLEVPLYITHRADLEQVAPEKRNIGAAVLMVCERVGTRVNLCSKILLGNSCP